MIQLNLFNTDQFEKVSRHTARAFYDEHHYLGGCGNAFMSYAQYVDGRLVACVSFATPAAPNVRRAWFGDLAPHVFELVRLAIAPDSGVIASQFVSRAVKVWTSERARRDMIPCYALISYADMSDDHHGGVYQAMSWLYCGVSESSSGFIDANGRQRHRRTNGANMTSAQASSLGLRAVKTGEKHRYLKLLGPKRKRGAMKSALCYPLSPYPKPDQA